MPDSSRRARTVRRLLTGGLLLLPLLFFALFYFYPLGAILRLGLWPEGRLDTAALGQLLSLIHI